MKVLTLAAPMLLLACAPSDAPESPQPPADELCGNGIIDEGEICDDGNHDLSDACPDGPSGSCVPATCGDGYLRTAGANSEQCDDGPLNSDTNPDTCRLDCTTPRCGDGVVDALELCDDGNLDDTDACPDGPGGDCAVASCGDGLIHVGVEACDDGAGNSDVTPNACRTSCAAAACGDGVVDLGEGCDDGNGVDTDACLDGASGRCRPAFCGDSVVRTDIVDASNPAFEQCDEGPSNSNIEPNRCRTDCGPPRCGDGIVDLGEQCDLGAGNSNTAPDTCRLSCLDPFCGDGVIDTGDVCDLTVRNPNRYPVRIDEGPDGRFYVSDANAGSVFIYASDLSLIGELTGAGLPLGVAVGSDNLLYVGSNEGDVVQIFSTAGEPVGVATGTTFEMPNDIAIDAAGNRYVVDSLLQTVRVIAPTGAWLRDIGTPDDEMGLLEDGELSFPLAVAIGSRPGVGGEELFVADQANYRVVVFDLTGVALRTFGSRREYLSDYQGKFAKLQSVAVDSNGNVHTADSDIGIVQILDPVTGAYLGEHGTPGSGPGELNLPLDLCIAADGRVVVTNNRNHRIEVLYTIP